MGRGVGIGATVQVTLFARLGNIRIRHLPISEDAGTGPGNRDDASAELVTTMPHTAVYNDKGERGESAGEEENTHTIKSFRVQCGWSA